ncbi:MAG: ion channel [Thermoplasmatota archaeon]
MIYLKKLIRRTYKGVIAIIILAFVAGVLFFYLEQGHQGESLSLFDSIYWAVVMMTTVGYGDFTPVTLEGRLIFIILGISVVVLWGFLASVVVSLVVESNLSGVFGLD